MPSFLLEIGIEELPADFSRQVIPQLSEMVTIDLDKFRISHGQVHCTSTPRRIVLLIEEISKFANDFIEERKGPPLSQAFLNGSPTQSAIGFARSCEVEIEDLEVRTTKKGDFVFAKKIEKGRLINDLLIELIPNWISNIQGRRFMRWGSGERRFSRPIRWIVSLLDDELIPIHLDSADPEVHSSRITRPHRLDQSSLSIKSASEYFLSLQNVGVEVNRDERKAKINHLVSQASKKYKAFPELSSSLLDELTDLVETPSLICGTFDSSFLTLPPEVLITVMRVHQRYIPLCLANTLNENPLALQSENILLTKFLCISNGLLSAKDNIKKGNERVLRARLADAKFFVESDFKVKSIQRNELLKNVSFSQGLGSVFDRVERIHWLVTVLVEEVIGPKLNIFNIKRAAMLCKHDLVSQMVGEFPELEGIIGGKYLLNEGESKEVALAVLEHYSPRFAGDVVPKSDAGSILALAERFELLFSIFSQGKRPTGSSDPYALRRAGNGIIQILFSRNWKFDINKFLSKSINHWIALFPKFNINKEHIIKDLSEFLRQRIISQLEDEEHDIDLIQSVVGTHLDLERLLSDLIDTRRRVELLSEMRKEGSLSSLQSVVARASRLASNSRLSPQVLSPLDIIDSSLFEKTSEMKILELIKTLEPFTKTPSIDSYSDLAKGLVQGSKALAEFFDGDNSVLVMSDDLKIRENRLNLLAILKNQAAILADFNEIVG
ncbi:glycine--tRNA ligase subunit beta [Prochlorococcus sp. MIT 1223]|uniref:glycine--tRNA ligase subunit beta n=1 Tax=Prochlorococcus sp. MIT 1223 TaxID=3096217 RepID=UPI002A7597F2|nr:glycine--tRNA ligase subunit beta [Prochlorococcus sp. MIT 1223]